MKNFIKYFILTTILTFCIVGCGNENGKVSNTENEKIVENNINEVDYSNLDNWYKCEYDGTKDVDTIFIYPTLIMSGELETTIEQNREAAESTKVYDKQASVFADATNIYMPLYRQIPLNHANEYKNDTFPEVIKNKNGYKDVTMALDYYFENYNNNKPFILAGHSQGSAMIISILTDYMQLHPEYLDRMVACYAIGYGLNKTEIAKYPSLKFAESETDTNCIISYNTYGPEHSGESILLNDDCYCINPLNWKTDDTYASIELNKGSFIDCVATEGLSDAKVNVEEGYLISNADEKYEAKMGEPLFGTHSFHTGDYGFFYENLKENVAKRIEAFLQ